MKARFAIALLLTCAACNRDEAPAEEIVEAAEEIVAPAEPTSLASGKWAPQDDCATVEGADAFRERLAAAVEARDADGLIAIAADDIKLDFGGGEGKAELRARLEDDNRDLWDELDELMALGCSVNEQGGITIPWIFDQDLGDADPAMMMLVTGRDVAVHAEPSASSKRVARVSWDLVEWSMVPMQAENEFLPVRLEDGTEGYMASDKLRSLLEHRLIASSRNGRWRITSFIAGD